MDKLWQELNMDNLNKNLSKAGCKAMRKILASAHASVHRQ